jgi:17beta-estradiol 17-dehydrogenase / very-long-chain 3-oxoacyl-CoA reductase
LSIASSSPDKAYIFLHSQLIKQLKKFGAGQKSSYAVVTGATSGIGLAFAFQLAKKGFNLVLISRSSEKLESIQADLAGKYHTIDIRVVPFDLANETDYESIVDCIKDIDDNRGQIRILINNAGRSHDIPVTFLDTEEEEMEGILALNCGGVLRVTKSVLPWMVKRYYSQVLF